MKSLADQIIKDSSAIEELKLRTKVRDEVLAAIWARRLDGAGLAPYDAVLAAFDRHDVDCIERWLRDFSSRALCEGM